MRVRTPSVAAEGKLGFAVLASRLHPSWAMHWLLEGFHWLLIAFAWLVAFGFCWALVLVGGSAERLPEAEATRATRARPLARFAPAP